MCIASVITLRSLHNKSTRLHILPVIVILVPERDFKKLIMIWVNEQPSQNLRIQSDRAWAHCNNINQLSKYNITRYNMYLSQTRDFIKEVKQKFFYTVVNRVSR